MPNEFDVKKELLAGFNTAFLDYASTSNLAFRPEFVSNNVQRGSKVLVSIEDELANCDEFRISVAFITKSGVTPLLQTLKELENKGIPGKVLTTDYLTFTDPEALDKLNSLRNIEVRMFRSDDESGGFHTKGYVFRKEQIFRIIIGSSNMTLNALAKNREWNTKFVSTADGEVTRDVLKEFDDLWDDKHTLEYADFIDQYKSDYIKNKIIREKRKEYFDDSEIDLGFCRLVPNKMQVEFVKNVLELRSKNVNKALLLSATGTGKSFASAFAVQEMKSPKVLFIVHREQIAKQTIKSYKKIFGLRKTYGLISGNCCETDKDFIFSTMQMMAKTEIQSRFHPDDFDVIIIDECHHAGNDSYQGIMNYFHPNFWLGMTASPDTNQYDIYSIFDHNIAYEIRLQQALEEDMLCPFHYFGISELEIDGEVFDDNSGLNNFSKLVCNERVKYVLEKAEYYGHSGDRVKGLVFCSRKDEARLLSSAFNTRKKPDGSNYRTEVITGEDSQERREEICSRLTKDDGDDLLDYIFTVDVFNEGVDLPEINQIILLRPTQSPVVFVQQLGRGLRKAENKEYVVILDFIGNYTNNFMIPIALSGDRSYNKDTMRRYVMEGSRVIPGCSTIHFDEISRKRIYESIDSARTNEIRLLRDSYMALKYKLGRIPTIREFKKYGSIDITKIFEKCGSYYAFLRKYDSDDYTVFLRYDEEIVIEYLSRKLCSYKRLPDAAVLWELIVRNGGIITDIQTLMRDQYGITVADTIANSVIDNLCNVFPKDEERRKFWNCVLVKKNTEGSITLTDEFAHMLDNNIFRSMVEEILTYAVEKNAEEYNNLYSDTSFVLNKKYTYEDVARLLGWKRNPNAQNVGGYFYDAETKTLPVFINYQKAEDAIAYEDRFLSENYLIALSKHPRKITSGDVTHIYKRGAEEQDNRIFLFVRKNKDDQEAKEFYFLGEIFAKGEPKPIHMSTTNDDAFEILYKLETPVRSDIYDYIVRD